MLENSVDERDCQQHVGSESCRAPYLVPMINLQRMCSRAHAHVTDIHWWKIS